MNYVYLILYVLHRHHSSLRLFIYACMLVGLWLQFVMSARCYLSRRYDIIIDEGFVHCVLFEVAFGHIMVAFTLTVLLVT